MSDWHILTVSEGGTVSVIKGLTEDAARHVMQSLADDLERPGFKFPEGGHSWVSYPNPGRIVRKECWGPDGQPLDIWKGWTRQPNDDRTAGMTRSPLS